jgi:hypothetical protein
MTNVLRPQGLRQGAVTALLLSLGTAVPAADFECLLEPV